MFFNVLYRYRYPSLGLAGWLGWLGGLVSVSKFGLAGLAGRGDLGGIPAHTRGGEGGCKHSVPSNVGATPAHDLDMFA